MIKNTTIKIATKTEIIWSVLFLEILRLAGVDDQYVIIFAIAYILLIFLKNKRIILPKIAGVRMYCIVIVFTLFYGLVKYDVREITKSLYYVGGSLLIIYLGFLYESKVKNKSLIKTIYLGTFIIAAQSLFVFVRHIGEMSSIENIRQYEGALVYEVGVAFIMLFVEKVFYKKIIFGKVIDYIFLIMYIVKIALSLSRSGIGQLGIELIVCFICIMLLDVHRIKARMVIVMSVLAISFITIFTLLPEDSVKDFNEKMDKSSEEVNSAQEFNSVGDAMHNWRAYEIYEAKKQWKKSNGFEMIFGEGMGASVKAQYIPLNWGEGMIIDNKLPILHNGFYTMLIIGGIVGVIAMLLLYCSPIALLYKNRKRIKIQPCLVATVAASIAMVFCTYVVNGIVTRALFLNWCLIYGCAYGMAWSQNDTESNEEEKE